MVSQKLIENEIHGSTSKSFASEIVVDLSPFSGTVLETIGVVVEPVEGQRTPSSRIPHEVPTRSGDPNVQMTDDSFTDYFLDE